MSRFLSVSKPVKGYKLVFYDDFKNGVDWTKWSYLYPGDQDNKGVLIYRKECVIKKDYGLCLIATTGITESGSRSGLTSDFVGMLSSHKFLVFKYGIVDIVAKMPPKGFTYFPALWLYDPTGWLPEIDMVELIGKSYSDPYTSSAYGSFTHLWSNDGMYQPEKYYYPNPSNPNHQIYCDAGGICKEFNWFVNMGFDLSAGFHTYSIKWSPTELIWYIDKREVFRALTKIPQKEQHLVLNIASAENTYIFKPSEIPQEMVIKSISIYQNF
jgi:beta-glucanase (GH16 family)